MKVKTKRKGVSLLEVASKEVDLDLRWLLFEDIQNVEFWDDIVDVES